MMRTIMYADRRNFLRAPMALAIAISSLIASLLVGAANAQESAFDKAYDPKSKTIRLNPDDPTGDIIFKKRDFSKDNRPPGPINVQRTVAGLAWHGIPTFFRLPVALTPEDLKAGKVEVAIMGVPMDNSGYGRPGTSFAAQAVRVAEVILPWGVGGITTETQVDPFTDLVMVDYGDIPVDVMSIERSLGSIRETVREVAEAGAIPIMVGGNHSIMYPHVLGVTDVHGKKNISIIHVDAHTDISSENFGHYVTIGNMVRLSVEEGLVDGKNMLAVGQRSPGYGPDKLRWYRDNGVRIYWQGEFENRGFREVLKDVVADIKAGPGKIFISIDIDVLDPAAAPGVTAPVMGGWTTRQLMELIRSAAVAADVVGADFVEYNPFLDDNARTTGLTTNNMIRELLTGIAMRKKGIREPFYYHPDILGGTRAPRK